MLHLDSHVWAKLSGPYGTAEQLPALLQRLEQAYSRDVFDELFQEYLYHQNTIYPATYAAMPYLARIACATDDAVVRQELFLNGGIIEAARDELDEATFLAAWPELAEEIGGPACVELYSGYLDAVGELRSLTEQVLAAAAEHADDMEKRYLLIADTAYRGDHIVANILLTFVQGDEYVGVCPSCEEEIYIWPVADDTAVLQAFASDPVFEPEQEPQPIVPDPSCGEAETRVLAERAAVIGERTWTDHLPYLAGMASCPSCSEQVRLWPAIQSTFEI
ncbi:hypothetical protein PA598K_02004 [Paenibacillus sp. 598K]|uniref:hypothetical protein n=1 Tax=Paenibacillus sp. 598K TaxID=1117987 RepID=UPI000FF92C14|nr:hypothetical protein [Paenibacillus sp. 598K]GBF73694.1 hypothetical protein PA598K_02004 [Paenibacillus sp. 598K]